MQPTLTQNSKPKDLVGEEREFDKKHPLQYAWNWWFDNPAKNWKHTQQTWGDHLKKIYTFSTVEDFWCLWNNIKSASDLPAGSNYHVFKEGIEPTWEDTQNIKGGKWVVSIKNSQRDSQLNLLWMWSVLACIGNTFEDEDEICGVVVSIRKGSDRISLWTRTALEDEKTVRIGQHLKDLLGIQFKIQYQAHADAKETSSSFNNKPRYEV